MTNRTKELFEFAQMEPVAILDMQMIMDTFNEEEIEHVEVVISNIKTAIANNDSRFVVDLGEFIPSS